MKTRRNKLVALSIIALVLIGTFLVLGLTGNNYGYFLSIRTPRILAIIITSWAIGFSTLIFQTITNNRILTPSVLGLDSLYVLIQSFIIFVLGSTSVFIINKNLNFTVSVLFMIIFSAILFYFVLKKSLNNIMLLLLVGIVMGTFFQSLTSFMQMMIDPNEFLHIQDSMFASFNSINTEILALSIILIIAIAIYSFKYLKIWDVLSLGRDNAINLGIEYDSIVQKMLIMVVILISISTALVGPITFLGLLVVNLAREFLKTYEHKYLIIGSTLLSIVALVGGQLLIERVFNFGTPISVIINFVGGVYFIYLLLKENVK